MLPGAYLVFSGGGVGCKTNYKRDGKLLRHASQRLGTDGKVVSQIGLLSMNESAALSSKIRLWILCMLSGH